jgi:hypothetical protein
VGLDCVENEQQWDWTVLRTNSSGTELPEDGINGLCRNMSERKLCDLMYPI